MNFEDQKDNKSEEVVRKSKKLMIIIGVILVFLLIGVIALIISIKNINEAQFKVFLDAKKIKADEETFVFSDNDIWISIEDFAKLVGYTYKNGEYKHPYSEESTKCYVSNGSESASYSLNSNTMYKAIEYKNADTNYDYFDLDEPVKSINNKLYTTITGISKGCNVAMSYNEKNNKLTIYSLPYLVQYYSNLNTSSALQENNVDYANQKVVLYNMIVVKDASTSKYGVMDLSNKTIIGEKYKSISFIESSKKFIVKTDNDKVGIISSTGATEIEPQYDSIMQIDGDTEKGLYLVKSNGKYGVIDSNGKTIVYMEYDKIGLEKASSFPEDDIENEYLLYGECIPVKRNNKCGLLNKNGNVILPVQFDELGCVLNNSSTNNLLLIPEYKAIVVRNDKLYGLYNSSGDNLIPTRVRNMYSITTSGEKSYYLTYDEVQEGQIMDVIDYLSNTLNIKPISSSQTEVEVNR